MMGFCRSAILSLLALSAAGCAVQGVPTVHIDCSAPVNRDCGSVAITITTSGSQTPTLDATVPVSAVPGLPLAASVTH